MSSMVEVVYSNEEDGQKLVACRNCHADSTSRWWAIQSRVEGGEKERESDLEVYDDTLGNGWVRLNVWLALCMVRC